MLDARFFVWRPPALSAALFLVACGGGGPPPSAPKPDLAGPVRLDLPSDKGQLLSLPAEGVRATVLDFWGPSCKPCRESVPALVARTADIEGSGARLELVAVLADGESTELAQQTLNAWGVQREFAIDRNNLSRSAAGVRELPTTLVVDEQGSVQWVAPQNAKAEDVVAAARWVADH
jgi:hypothetical protein